jgi:hypothetical protein
MCASSQTFRSTSAIIRMRGSRKEAHMRRILSIALALAGIFVSVMASPSKTTTEMDATENHVIVEGF